MYSSTIFLFASQTEKCVTCILSPDLEEREEDRKIQKLIKRTLKEKKDGLKNGLNRQILEELGQEIREVFFPHSNTVESVKNETPVVEQTKEEEKNQEKKQDKESEAEAKTSDLETSPETPALVEEKKLTQTTGDKTDLQEESQTPEA